MRKETKAKKAAAGLLDFLKSQGVSTEEIEEVPHIRPSDFKVLLEAEGILLSLHSDRRSMKVKLCKGCEQPFATNYEYVAYCTNACRALELKKIGIVWNPVKTDEERWGSVDYPSQIPMVVGPEALSRLSLWIKNLEELQNQIETLEAERHRQLRIQNETPLEKEARERRSQLAGILQDVYAPVIQQTLQSAVADLKSPEQSEELPEHTTSHVSPEPYTPPLFPGVSVPSAFG